MSESTKTRWDNIFQKHPVNQAISWQNTWGIILKNAASKICETEKSICFAKAIWERAKSAGTRMPFSIEHGWYECPLLLCKPFDYVNHLAFIQILHYCCKDIHTGIVFWVPAKSFGGLVVQRKETGSKWSFLWTLGSVLTILENRGRW